MTGMKVFVERKGRKRELTGWRKWTVAIVVLPIVALIVAVAIVLAFGLAFTIGAVLLVAVPALVILAGLALMFGRFEMRTSAD